MLVAAQSYALPADEKETLYASESNPPSTLPNEGLLPEGSLVEISGPEARLQAARILAKNRHLPSAWVEQNLEALPDDIFRVKMDFKKVLFINGRRDSAWAISSLINSQEFPVVVFSAPYENEKFLRRLRHQARKSGTTVLLLREEPCFSWTIRVQLRALNKKLEVLRWRKS